MKSVIFLSKVRTSLVANQNASLYLERSSDYYNRNFIILNHVYITCHISLLSFRLSSYGQYVIMLTTMFVTLVKVRRQSNEQEFPFLYKERLSFRVWALYFCKENLAQSVQQACTLSCSIFGDFLCEVLNAASPCKQKVTRIFQALRYREILRMHISKLPISLSFLCANRAI